MVTIIGRAARVVASKPAALLAGAALAAISASAFAAIDLPASKEQLTELGRQHRTALDLYRDFEKQAGGGQRLAGLTSSDDKVAAPKPNGAPP